MNNPPNEITLSLLQMQDSVLPAAKYDAQIKSNLFLAVSDYAFDMELMPSEMKEAWADIHNFEYNCRDLEDLTKEAPVAEDECQAHDYNKQETNPPDVDFSFEVQAETAPPSLFAFEDSESQFPFQCDFEREEDPEPHMILEKVPEPVEVSLKAAFERYYFKNEIDLKVWNNNPTLRRLLPVLLENLQPSHGILLVQRRLPTQLLKKLWLLITRNLRQDQELVHELGPVKAATLKVNDFKNECRQLVAKDTKIFERVVNLPYFKFICKQLCEETESDIQTNLLKKFDDVDQQKIEQGFAQAIDEEGNRRRTFKTPCTMMEILWTLVLFCNELLHELGNSQATMPRRAQVELIKEHFVKQLTDGGFLIDEAVYPVKRSQGVKDLYFQAFLRIV